MWQFGLNCTSEENEDVTAASDNEESSNYKCSNHNFCSISLVIKTEICDMKNTDFTFFCFHKSRYTVRRKKLMHKKDRQNYENKYMLPLKFKNQTQRRFKIQNHTQSTFLSQKAFQNQLEEESFKIWFLSKKKWSSVLTWHDIWLHRCVYPFYKKAIKGWSTMTSGNIFKVEFYATQSRVFELVNVYNFIKRLKGFLN